MSSFVSGSNPTSSTICFMRLTIESPIRAWDWMMTKFKAVSRMRGVLIGGVSRRVTIDLAGVAGVVGIVGGARALARENGVGFLSPAPPAAEVFGPRPHAPPNKAVIV